MPTDTAEHWEHIAGRALNVPGAIRGYIDSLRQARDAGKVAAARQVSIVIEQTTKYAAEDGFFAKLAAGAGPPTARCRRTCRRSSTPVLPPPGGAYTELADFLRTELLPAAPEKDAVGRERYALASRSFLGAAVDLEETYAWGVQELDRLIAEQEKVAEHHQARRQHREAKEILNNDPARQLKGTDALRPGCRNSPTRPLPNSPACTSRSPT